MGYLFGPFSPTLSEKLSSLPHPPILAAFYDYGKIILFIVIEQAISQ